MSQCACIRVCARGKSTHKLSPASSQALWTPPPVECTKNVKRPALSNGHILVQLQSRAKLPESILIHDIEGYRVECGRQMHLILLTPEGAQGLPHSGCPTGEDPSTSGQATPTFFASGTRESHRLRTGCFLPIFQSLLLTFCPPWIGHELLLYIWGN